MNSAHMAITSFLTSAKMPLRFELTCLGSARMDRRVFMMYERADEY